MGDCMLDCNCDYHCNIEFNCCNFCNCLEIFCFIFYRISTLCHMCMLSCYNGDE